MFARQTFRAVQPLKSQCRRYASPSDPTGQGGSNAFMFTGLGLLAASMGYYYYKNGVDPSKIKAAAKEAEAKAKELTGRGSAPAGPPAFTGGDQGFISLKLESIENVNHNTKKFRFALPESEQVSGLKVASALLTKFKGPEMEKAVLRPYTPVSDEGDKGYIDLLVKVYPGGKMSNHMFSMQPDQRLDFKGPLPKYPITPNQHDHIALIAGGTGITPMYQVARAIFNNPEDKTKVTLVFGNVSEDDILLKKELEHLENTYPQRFRAFYVLDKAPKEWTGGRGFITKELLKTVLPEPKSENIKIFVCGPPPLYKAISGGKTSPSDQGELSGILKDLGYSKDQVFKF